MHLFETDSEGPHPVDKGPDGVTAFILKRKHAKYYYNQAR
ncbi:hypothetical protein ACVWZZ_005859 [Bradyrhizobium sp. LM6.10]